MCNLTFFMESILNIKKKGKKTLKKTPFCLLVSFQQRLAQSDPPDLEVGDISPARPWLYSQPLYMDATTPPLQRHSNSPWGN